MKQTLTIGHGRVFSFDLSRIFISFFFRSNDDQDHEEQTNPIDSSGLMHLITTGGTSSVTDHQNDESIGTLPIVDQVPTVSDVVQHIEENPSDALVTVPSVHSAPIENDPTMDIETSTENANPSQQTTTSTTSKSQHNIEEIHREMLNLIPIPQAWPHIQHQSRLFSYPDLPHFNVIRQATFREGRFVCPFCTVDFASKEGIRYHLYNSCTKSPYPKAFFRCLMCGSELADRSSLRTHLARHGAEDGSAISVDQIDVSRKPALPSTGNNPTASNSKKSKKKKKTNNDSAVVVPPPPQLLHPMLAVTAASVSPRGLDGYALSNTMINPSMSLPIIKSDGNDADSKVRRKTFLMKWFCSRRSFSFSENADDHRKRNRLMDQRQQLRTPNIRHL